MKGERTHELKIYANTHHMTAARGSYGLSAILPWNWTWTSRCTGLMLPTSI
jgi:hypothetical protein